MFFVLIWSVVPCNAQLKIVPIENSKHFSIEKENSQRVTASLSLPFFDDFSTTRTRIPDESFWLFGSGVHINNTLTTGQPSVNVATFDGLNQTGLPYNFINPLFENFTDTLTSKPIDMAAKSISDSIYISFYWQSGILIEKPDSSDFIQLEFLGLDQKWEVVWKKNGYLVDSLFHHDFVALKSTNWFHENFQFRFRSFGRSSGAYDMWHLDYVYLNEKRTSKDIYIRDLAVTQPLTSFLKTYTSMPLSHYLKDPARFTASTISSRITNLYNSENRTSFELTIRDSFSGKTYPGAKEGSTYIGPLESLTKNIALKPIQKEAGRDSLRLVLKFNLLTTDNQNPSIPTIDLTRNDTISAFTDLTNYFAYDDGSAEYGVQINQKRGRVAIQFIMAKPDTVGGVSMSLIPFNKDISGQSFTLQLLSNKNGKPDQVLTQKAFISKYGRDGNGVYPYVFDKTVAVTDTFYVGWLQVNDQALTVGYDLNSTYGASKAYYNLGNEWIKSKDLRGSIIIRPFISKQGVGIITGVEKEQNILHIYPNPSSGIVRWKMDNLKFLEVIEFNGELIKIIKLEGNQKFCDLSELANGIYFLRGYINQQRYVQKIMINN